jgi:hypothetical protein
MRTLILLLVIGCFIIPQGSFAQTKEASGEELTKGEAIMLLSATDFMKKKIADLVSWTIGYDISKLARMKLTPTINYVIAEPRKIPPDGRTVYEIFASVDDPGGLGNIAGVRADLSSVGRLPNTILVDNGLFGDKEASDGVYTLQASIPMKIDVGQKEITIAVANKKGWLALAKTTLRIKKNPAIVEARFTPESVRADGRDVVTLTVKIENPGRVEDIKSVTADLRGIGYSALRLLRNDGKIGDLVAGDEIFSLQFVIAKSVKAGDYPIRVGASNLAGGYIAQDIILRVYK